MSYRNILFLKGKEALLAGDLESAEKNFSQSSRKDRYGPATDYLLFVHLARSDYRKITALSAEKPPLSDLSMYSMYWFYKMTGDQHEADALLDKMLDTRQYFLRLFAAKELYLKGRLPSLNLQDVLSSGLHYEMPFEEERAAVFLDLLRGDRIKAADGNLKLLALYPWLPDLYLDRLEILECCGDERSLKSLTGSAEVRSFASKDHRIMAALAKYFYLKQDYQQAAEYLDRLITYFRNNPIFLYHLANIRLSEKQYVKAVQTYEEALKLAPLFERAWYNMGICLYRLGEIEKSSESFGRALSIKKESDAVFNLSVCMIEKKHFKEAYFNLNRIRAGKSEIPVDAIQEKIKLLLSYT